MQNSIATLEDRVTVCNELNIGLSYDPEIMLLVVYLNDVKHCGHTKTCAWMFIATLLVSA